MNGLRLLDDEYEEHVCCASGCGCLAVIGDGDDPEWFWCASHALDHHGVDELAALGVDVRCRLHGCALTDHGAHGMACAECAEEEDAAIEACEHGRHGACVECAGDEQDRRDCEREMRDDARVDSMRDAERGIG